MVIDILPQCALSRRRRRDCFQAHLVLETCPPFRLILCWTILYLPQWNLIVESLKECAQRAAEFGVTLGVQNHHDIAVDHRSQRDLINAVDEPNCKALFDAWAPALQGTDIVEAARVMAPMTAHTTIANYQKRPRFC